jgi:hypothetical protein
MIIKKLEYNTKTLDPFIPVHSDYSVSLSLINYNTSVPFDTKDCVGDNAIIYNILIKDTSKLDLNKYRLTRDVNLDAFDPNSPAFHTRCVIKPDRKYGADTTINYRRKNYYQNMVAVCPTNCVYKGIDISNYLQCQCNATSSDVSFYFKEDMFANYTFTNLNIVECPHIAFVLPKIEKNPGFIIGVILNGLFILGTFVLCLGRSVVLRGSTTKLYYSDYLNNPGINKLVDDEYKPRPTEVEMIKPPSHSNKPSAVALKDEEEPPKGLSKPAKTIISVIMPNPSYNPITPADIVLEEEDYEGGNVQFRVTGEIGQMGKEILYKNKHKTETEESDFYPYRGNPKKSSGPLEEETIGVTLRDIGSQRPSVSLSAHGIDKRGVCAFYFDYLAERTFCSLVLKSSILSPFWLRFNYCILFLSILFVVNAMMFFDDYIEARINLPYNERVSIKFNILEYIRVYIVQRTNKGRREPLYS